MKLILLILMIIFCLALISVFLYLIISNAIYEEKMQRKVDEWNKDPRHIPVVRE